MTEAHQLFAAAMSFACATVLLLSARAYLEQRSPRVVRRRITIVSRRR